MRLQVSTSKNAASFYMVKSVTLKGRRTNEVVEKLGTYEELKSKLNGQDPYVWAKEYVKEQTRLEKEGREPEVIARYSPTRLLEKDKQQSFHGGYLFLQRIYHELGLSQVCKEIKQKHKFEYNLDAILSRMLYGRILYPCSKLSTCELSKKLIEQPEFELQHIYRALGVIAEETDLIQSRLYLKQLEAIQKEHRHSLLRLHQLLL